jgi:hypothetical protein
MPGMSNQTDASSAVIAPPPQDNPGPVLDDLIGDWLRDLADASRLGGLLTAIAIDGKWLRGIADGQVKLFAAMLHQDKVLIAPHRVPDETTRDHPGQGTAAQRHHTELDRGHSWIIRRSIWVAVARDTKDAGG